MPLTVPPELKKITPYIRRAEELDRDKANPESRLVSYYCRQYAVHTGISLATSPAGKTCLGDLLGNLEGEKQAMDSFTRDESKFLCTKFAEKIFDKADSEDRAGQANKNTAKTFYAAASFLEILQQFYSDNDDTEEVTEQKKKSVYCKWKATEILKAIKEGRTPTPGGYEENNNNSNNDYENEKHHNQDQDKDQPQNITSSAQSHFLVETVNEENDYVHNDDDDDDEKKDDVIPSMPGNDVVKRDDCDKNDDDDEISDEGTEVQLGPPPAYSGDIEPVESPSILLPVPPPLNIPKPPMTFVAPPPPPPPPPAIDEIIPPPVPTSRPSPPSTKKKFLGGLMGSIKQKKKVGKIEIADCTELCKFALAALDDKDTDLAAERLQQALQVLGR